VSVRISRSGGSRSRRSVISHQELAVMGMGRPNFREIERHDRDTVAGYTAGCLARSNRKKEGREGHERGDRSSLLQAPLRHYEGVRGQADLVGMFWTNLAAPARRCLEGHRQDDMCRRGSCAAKLRLTNPGSVRSGRTKRPNVVG